jgi:hypothetical protein
MVARELARLWTMTCFDGQFSACHIIEANMLTFYEQIHFNSFSFRLDNNISYNLFLITADQTISIPSSI